MNLAIVALFTLLFNLPFGYWRSNVAKFSLKWFLSIHLPIPVIYLVRHTFGVHWSFFTLPILLGSFFLGQFLGKKLHGWWKVHLPI